MKAAARPSRQLQLHNNGKIEFPNLLLEHTDLYAGVV
jgi:hypothetical protein